MPNSFNRTFEGESNEQRRKLINEAGSAIIMCTCVGDKVLSEVAREETMLECRKI